MNERFTVLATNYNITSKSRSLAARIFWQVLSLKSKSESKVSFITHFPQFFSLFGVFPPRNVGVQKHQEENVDVFTLIFPFSPFKLLSLRNGSYFHSITRFKTMVYSFYDKNSFSGSHDLGLFNPTFHNLGAFNDVSQGGLSSSHSLVFESEKEELVKCPATAKVGKDEISEAKALAALKSHSEAERRRRERINGHLATLRGLVPSTEKMDKATLLAEVISQVKELKKNAVEASKGFLIPMDADEVKVEPYNDEGKDGSMSYSATICCDFRPEILSDLKQTLHAFQLHLVRAEISTLAGRMKNVFIFTCCKGDNINTEACQALASNVHQALCSVLDKASTSLEFSLRTSYPSKRRRLCFIETSTSSCYHGSCSC
ncbi:hypothetical protein VNO77_04847 [Canavalia gladiata]|uniref:BHLH domain-containing protein n=1 Tax=Canavalia gladiata TaxID=3824 RepID=A0AAN9MZA3_CANGL